MRRDDLQTSGGPPSPDVLMELWPAGRDMLASVAGSNRLYGPSTEPGSSLFDSLYRLLSYPRAPGLNPWDVCRTVLARILTPETNTQKIAVPFTGADELSSMTCSVAARIYTLVGRAPAEYARWVEQLTSPALMFFVTRVFADPNLSAAAESELRRYAQVVRLGPRTLRLFLTLDPEGLGRAVVEQFHVRPCAGEGSKETRHAVDVLVQSALMNFLMSGAYSSATDAHRATGERGVVHDDAAAVLLDNLILRAAGGTTAVMP